ncbi:MAG TPA: disulfide bond formation protein B [Stellaceae bacterium]|nr:disulfide bond formation protein B [Stellaceae bacterium]
MTRTRLTPLLILVPSLGVVGTALLSQYVGGLQPCELCELQRLPYYAVIALAILALWRPRLIPGFGLLAGLIFLVSAGLAFYHLGVEQHWFPGPSACTASGTAASIAELRAQILASRSVRCDEPQWALFGISLAGWNVLASLLLAGAAFSRRRA